jgi:hypothetical protein
MCLLDQRGVSMSANRKTPMRRGGVYIAVLGSALVISLLGITALIGQRIQSRTVTAASDIRQAQLNAATAVELGLLKIKTDSDWRSQLDAQSYLIKNRGLAAGVSTCSLQVFDAPTDTTLNADKPLKFVAIGRRGAATGDLPRTTAEQRIELVIEPRRKPHDCLKQSSTALPDWPAIFAYYGGPPDAPNGIGTKIELASLDQQTPNFSQNPSLNDGHSNWTRNFPDDFSDYRDADDSTAGPYKGHTACLHVERNDWREGVANRLLATFLKPATAYNVNLEIDPNFGALSGGQSTAFRIRLMVEYPDGSTELSANSIVQTLAGSVLGTSWTPVSGTLLTPTWSQPPTAVYLVINSNTSAGTHQDFYVDNLSFYEGGARFIYQKVLGPGLNPFGATTNSSGIYWIDCQGAKLVIERSRIVGTLLVLNPGADSRVAYGPYHWTPAVPGYPALLVNGSFTIQGTLATDPRLREVENFVNYNPAGAPHRDFGTDNWLDGVVASEVNNYESQIHGLIGISGNMTYQFSPPIRGRAIVGGSVSGTPAFTYKLDSLLNPPPPLGGFYTYRHDRRPASVRKNVLP